MADFTQGSVVTLLSHQAVTHPATLVGSANSVATYISATIWIQIGRVEATAPAGDGIIAKIQGNPESSGNEDWQDLVTFQSNTTAADDQLLSGAEAQGSTSLGMSDTTGFAVGDYCYVQDASVVADGEWVEVHEVVTNTSLEIFDGLANAKDSADTVYNEADRFKASIDCSGLARIRVVIRHEEATGPNIHVISKMLPVTDFE